MISIFKGRAFFFKKAAPPIVELYLPSRLEMKKKDVDVYLLSYDAYVANETMKSYGIDNSEQEDFLRSKGFRIYPKAYSIDIYSAEAMAPLLDMGPFGVYDLPRRKAVFQVTVRQ